MSWQLASFLVIGAVLVAGFAWYERSRPPSQTVALVAALAALAVAGRLALAAIPNVVATTDIVLIAGYSVGAAPGFAVGALAGVVSNFWLGQGPWTPWQMAGWGMVGVAGAGLRILTRGRAGRITLASACGLAAVFYGALLNFSLMASYGGEMSFDRFLVLEGRAVPFDAAHAIGNVTLALLAGPAMIRMLVRFRERFEWRRAGAEPRRAPAGAAAGAVTALLALAICLPLLAPARAQAADVDAAATWLVAAQNGDGGFGTSPGAESSTAMTGWAMLGLEAAGRNPLDVSKGGTTPIGFLTRKAGDITSTGDLARTILALVGAGVEPRNFANRNLLKELRGRMRKTGSFEGWPNATAFGILALRAGGSPAGLEESLSWLRKVQNDDGGWGSVPGAQSDADSTGAVLQVIHGKARDRAIRYLRRHQRSGGGFATGGSGPVNSQSTAWAVQGMLAAGVDPASIHEGGGNGLDYIDRRQASDGHFRYSKSSDQTPVWVTGQVLVAAASDSYPLAAVPREPASSEPAPSGTTNSTPSAPSTGKSATPTFGKSGVGGAAGAGAVSPGAGAPETESPPTGSAAGSKGAVGQQSTDGPRRVASVRLEPEDDSGPPPAAPIGIGAGTALLAGGGTLWLGRRRRW